VAEHRLQHLLDTAGLGDHLEARLGAEQQPQRRSDDLMIVGEHDPSRWGHASILRPFS
jgi:hypothetical protein